MSLTNRAPARKAVPLSTKFGSTHTVGALTLTGWALYITVVTASNVSDLIASLGWEHWAFRSGNLDYINTATKIYLHVRVVDQILLAGAIAWEGAAAVLLWMAVASWARRSSSCQLRARTGLTTLALLWFAFAISTELFVAYDRGVDETAYWALAIGVLSTLILTEILDRAPNSNAVNPDRPFDAAAFRGPAPRRNGGG